MRDSITIYSIANRARQLRTVYQHRHRCNGTCLIVEGELDQQVYYNLIDSSKCYIVMGHGKEKAVGALQELEKNNFAGVLCIIDADFSVLSGEEIASKNILITDTLLPLHFKN